MERYAMYLRKSRADMELEAIGEGETLAKHRKTLYALAERMDILPERITEYKEIVSGESIEDRPEIQRLLADVFSRKYAGVFVMEVERLARGNTRDQGEVAEAFQYTGTKIITPAKIYNPESDTDQEYFEFGLFMSRREYKTIRRRLEAGTLQAVMEGNYLLPQRVFGYDIKREGKGNRYLVPNGERELVQRIFDWFTEDGKSCGWIARRLTLMGIPTMQGAAEWHRQTVSKMLANPVYVGYLVWGQKKTVRERDGQTGKLIKKRVKTGEVKRVKGKHEAIITEEQFAKAQERLKAAPVNHELEMVSPLAGVLHCAECGRALNWIDYKDGRGVRYSHAYSAKCHKKSLRAEVVIEGVESALLESIAECRMKLETGAGVDMERHMEAVDALEAEREKLERKRRKLFDDYEDGTYTKSEFLERKTVYSERMEELEKAIKEAKETAPKVVNYAERIAILENVVETIKREDVSPDRKNAVIRAVISDIRYDVEDYGRGKGGRPMLDVIYY